MRCGAQLTSHAAQALMAEVEGEPRARSTPSPMLQEALDAIVAFRYAADAAGDLAGKERRVARAMVRRHHLCPNVTALRDSEQCIPDQACMVQENVGNLIAQAGNPTPMTYSQPCVLNGTLPTAVIYHPFLFSSSRMLQFGARVLC